MEATIALGKTNLQVSPLGLGVWQWGDQVFWEYGKSNGIDPQEARASFQASLAAGINFFDTAEIYGNGVSETLLGECLRESSRSVIVATKFMPLPWRLQRSSLIDALRKSLSRLGMESVDLYQIHWPYPPVPIETWVEGLAEAVQLGLTRAVGVSNYNLDQMRRAMDVLARHNIPLASNQVSYSLLDRGPEKSGLLRGCQELGVTLIAYSPLYQGLLTGKYTTKNPPPGIRRLRNLALLPKIGGLVQLLERLGEQHSKTAAQVALNWLLCKGTLPIPGAKSVRQVEQNCGALGWRLSEAEVAELDEASARVG